nr:Optomotor-blind protein [Ipomoea batatas]
MKPLEVSRPDNLARHELQPRTDTEEEKERSMEAELMRFSGPARFLCTIKEETMEDLESDDVKCRDDSKGRMETPFLTPIASPLYFTPPLTPVFGLTDCKCSSSWMVSSFTSKETPWQRSTAECRPMAEAMAYREALSWLKDNVVDSVWLE